MANLARCFQKGQAVKCYDAATGLPVRDFSFLISEYTY